MRTPGPPARVALLLLCIAAPLAARQAGAPAGPASGVVVGQVVDADTGRPVGGAIVAIRATTRPAGGEPFNEQTITDRDGRFVFSQIPPANYLISSVRPGYIPAQHGQFQPRGHAGALRVGTNTAVTDATVRMWAYGAIGGAVTDAAGEPVVGATVRAAQVVMSAGRRLLRRVLAQGMTDDRGAYRIANLTPGDYVVFVPSTVESAAVSTATWYAGERAQAGTERARLLQFSESRAPSPSPNGLRVGESIVSSMSMLLSTAPMVRVDGRLDVVPTAYHPSAPTLDGATTIRISSGEERPGVDIGLSHEPGFHIKGTVAGLDGPGALIGVRLFRTDISEFETDYEQEVSSTVTGLDGRFTLLGVPAGRYILKVLRVPRLPANPDAPEPATLWARQPIAVGDTDVDNVTVQLKVGARVSGRIQFEGAAAPEPGSFGPFAVRLIDATGQGDAAYLRPPAPKPDGSFHTLGYPPGRYFVDVVGSAPATAWRLKSVTLGARDLVDEPLELGTDDVEGVVLTLADRLGEIAGTVTGLSADQKAQVVVLPADHRQWIANGMPAARTATAYTDDGGRFAIGDLRAGAYLAVALPAGAPEPDLQDPTVIGRLVSIGTAVQVSDRATASVALSLSRIGRQP